MTDEAFSGQEPCPITAELIARLKERFDAQAQEIERLKNRAEAAEARVLDLTNALTDALARCNQYIDDAAAIEAATK